MTVSKADKDLCRLITPRFRLSYPHLFKPQAPKGSSKLKYSATMLFSKKVDLMGTTPDGKPRSLKAAIKNAKIAAFGPDKTKWPQGIASPIVDGDDPKYADKEGYKDHWVIKASTGEDQRPSVVGPDMTPITDPNEIYPGCYARAYVFARVYEYMGKCGVHFILDHVQKLGDGKSFGGKKPVESVFSPMNVEEDEAEDSDDDDGEDFV